MNDLVSIIIPSYKGLDKLKEVCLPAIFNQTYTNYEILIGNDGEDLELKSFLSDLNNPRIKYFEFTKRVFKTKKEQWTVGGAFQRNELLKICNGDYIAPIDQDDLWGPTFLEVKINELKNNPETQMVYSVSYCVSHDTKQGFIGTALGPAERQRYLKKDLHNIIPHLSVVYRSELKNFEYPISGEVPADYTLWTKMVAANINIKFLNLKDCIYNFNNNTNEGIRKVYFNIFKTPLKKL